MPIHDWTRVNAEWLDDFQFRWFDGLVRALTSALSADFQVFLVPSSHRRSDVYPRHVSSLPPVPLDWPPGTIRRVARKQLPPDRPLYRLAIQPNSGFGVVALVDIVSPRNEDRRASAEEFIAKGREAIDGGVHLTVIDLFPPTRSIRRGLAAGIWRKYDRVPVVTPAHQPLCVASFAATDQPEAFFKFLAVGEELPGFPLFLTDTLSVNLPLADTYAAAFAGSPPYLRELLSQPAAPTGA